jgi:toxin ParE1/3/4
MREIFAWTAKHFGIKQARRCRSTILAALRDVSNGPDIIAARERADIRPNLRSLHIARLGRHVILFTASEDNPQIRIIRILHDSMDLALTCRPVPTRDRPSRSPHRRQVEGPRR